MWYEAPEQRLNFIRQRQGEMMADAADDKSGRPQRQVGNRIAGFSGLQIHLGTILIAVGHTLREEDALRHHSVHS
jgi:hypothetical protein